MVWSKSKIIVVIILIAVGSSVSTAFAVGGSNIIFKTFDGITNHEVMRITSDQKVGIGTTTPNSKLTVNGDTVTSGFGCVDCINSADISPSALQLQVSQKIGSLVNVGPGQENQGIMACNSNEKVTGGGFIVESGDSGKLIPEFDTAEILDNIQEWHVIIKNTGSTTGSFVVTATCTSIGTTPSVTIPPGTAVSGCELNDQCFIPPLININVGQTVLWRNLDTTAHSVVSGNPNSGPDGIFDSGVIAAGSTFSHTFPNTGIYDYYDSLHPWMIGRVNVGTGQQATVLITLGSGSSASAPCVAQHDCYHPNPLNIAQGTTVIWNNIDSVSHTVTSGMVTDNNSGSLFDSGLIPAGHTFQYTFRGVGTFNYFDSVHPWDTGTIIVS